MDPPHPIHLKNWTVSGTPLASSHPEIFVPNSLSLGLTFGLPLALFQPDRWISNVSSPLFSQLVTIFSYFRLTSLIPPLCWNQDYGSGAMKGERGCQVADWRAAFPGPLKPETLAVPSPLRPEPVYMTYGVWAPPLPIPLWVQFSDKQKHIQALASHFTLCALAGGNAFLEPLA